MAKSSIKTARKPFPAQPQSWSELSWQQLNDCWRAKMRYGGNGDVARAAALLALLGLSVCSDYSDYSEYSESGEAVYLLKDRDGGLWTVTPRELSQMAKAVLPWFDFPYGDPGKEAVKDESGKVVEEAVAPVRGYVSQMRDALILPEETVMARGLWFRAKRFALPQLACNNLTWQQYRSLQAISPQLFQEGVGEEQVLGLQAQFLAHCLVPRSLALLDTSGNTIRIRPHWEYTYDATRAEGLVGFWRRRLPREAVLFHICLQAYQTALVYYASAYPLLFSDDGKNGRMQDALQGEVGTINTVMKYAGYAEQQQVYDSNLPFVLDILNTMAKEAKQIEAMNARIKRK